MFYADTIKSTQMNATIYIEIMIMMHCTAGFCTLHHLKNIYIYYI